MKRIWLILLGVLMASSVFSAIFYVHYRIETEAVKEDFFFGVSFGSNKTSEAKLMIDKVKGYTNFFLINDYDLTTNEPALNEVCEYAFNADLHFMVFFDWISLSTYPWHQTWLDTAKERFGDKFLGIYLYDEPGGRQIDQGYWKGGANKYSENVSDYNEAAEAFVTDIPSLNSTKDLKRRNITMFTSDYALYWFDYLAGYDTVFVELGWNHSRTQHIALGRGAANVQDKDWGAIITWTYENPPYLENGTRLLEDMKTAYQAGAKYVTVFNFPYDQPYGIIKEEHFAAMKTFWNMIHSPYQIFLQRRDGEVAFVLPKDYGWGMRTPDDNIWFPYWGPDKLSPQIWENMNKLIAKYGHRLDIIYSDTRFNFTEKYSEIYYWDSVIN